jgi:CheY-like chemotaxis protein
MPRRMSLSGAVLTEPKIVTSVLICDDRAEFRRELAHTLRASGSLHSSVDIDCVGDGVAMLEHFRRAATDLVLIGVHAGSIIGTQAIGLLLESGLSASSIIFGSPTDLDLLAGAFARGAGGLLLWEPTNDSGGCAAPVDSATPQR